VLKGEKGRLDIKLMEGDLGNNIRESEIGVSKLNSIIQNLHSEKDDKPSILFKMKGKHLDTDSDHSQNPTKRRNLSVQKADKIGTVIISRTSKHFIIKVCKIRLIDKYNHKIRLAHSKDYNEKIKNIIIMSVKQGMKLLIDFDNDYQAI